MKTTDLTDERIAQALQDYTEAATQDAPTGALTSPTDDFEALLNEVLETQKGAKKPRKTAAQAFQEFLKYYCPEEAKPYFMPPITEETWWMYAKKYMPIDKSALVDVTGTVLTPSYHGKECLGNGEFVGYECCCDECDFYLLCFPEWNTAPQRSNEMQYTVVGYFIEGRIFSGNRELPPRKTPVISIDTDGRKIEDIGADEEIRVLSAEQNWYTIKKSQLLPIE